MQKITFNPEDWTHDKASFIQYSDGSIKLFEEYFRFEFSYKDNFECFSTQHQLPVVKGYEFEGRWFAYSEFPDIDRYGETPQIAAAKVLANIW